METLENIKNDWQDLSTFNSTGIKLKNSFISICNNGLFNFSSGFIHNARDQMKNMTHVILSYSVKKKAIVFQFTNDKNSKGIFKLSKTNTYAISARSFFNYYDISAEKFEGKYSPQLEIIPNKGKYWVIYLDKKI